MVAPIAPPITVPISDSGLESLTWLPAAAPTSPPTIVPDFVSPSIDTFFNETTSPYSTFEILCEESRSYVSGFRDELEQLVKKRDESY